MRSIVAPYIWPGFDERWADALASSQGPDSMFIINPNSGPGVVRDPAWVRCIEQIHQAGHRAIGYSATGRGARALVVIDEIGTYSRLYPELDGIFLDEFPAENIDPVAADRLSAAILLARRLFSPSRNSMDAFRVITNPGVMPTQQVVDAVPRIGVWIVHEDRDPNGPSLDDITAPRNPGYLEVKRQAWLSYNDPAVAATHVRLAALGWQWGYSVSDPAPAGNPWDRDPAT